MREQPFQLAIQTLIYQITAKKRNLTECNQHITMEFRELSCETGARVGLVVKALRYKPAGRGFDSRWCHWNFSVT
jgi:hypothetical protein